MKRTVHVASSFADAFSNVFDLLLVRLLFDLVVEMNHVELLSLGDYIRIIQCNAIRGFSVISIPSGTTNSVSE